MSKKILITGATGYLGRHLVKHFSAMGQEITALVRKSSNLEALKEINPQMRFITEENLEDVGEVDVFIHTATAYGRKGESEEEIFSTNKDFPLKILNSINHPTLLFINTDTSLPKGLNAYSTSKKEFVEEVEVKFPKLKTVNLICEQFYGPEDGTFLTFVKNSLEKGSPIEMTDGTQKRDFLFIDDLVEVYGLVFKKQEDLSTGLNNFEVGYGESFPIKEITLLAAEILGGDSDLFLWGAKPMRENEVMNSVANINKLKSLGWEPKFSLKEGMEKTYRL